MVKPSFNCCGTIRITKTERAKWVDKGWLGNDGICQFPDNVQAFPMDVRLNGLPPQYWETANDQSITSAIKKGWILFVDGNGVAMTKAKYMAKYPDYPDPEMVLRLQKKLPPGRKGFYKIGSY